ncbi:MAG TPA: hypothetical protein VKT53_11600 [Candidatus Acidoferrum sp.]|nr:hypothetical protein [Candidatus Acidoferrum sp.]
MGTAGEWIEVVFATIFWGGWMLFWMTKKKKAAAETNAWWPNVVLWFFAGLCFGLTTTFHWRALRVPLVFVTVSSFACMLAAGWFAHPKNVDNR